MIALALYLFTLASPVAAPACEELGPRPDGTYVIVCHGAVTRVRDGRGNSRAFDPVSGAILIQEDGATTMVLP